MTLSWMHLRDTWLAVVLATLLPYGCGRLLAQTTNLNLSSATSDPGSTVNLNLSLTALGTSPAGLEWTFTYPSSQISVNSVTVGSTATAAGKTLSCAPPSSGSITCLLTGLNTNTMASGVAAIIQLAVPNNALTTAINITNTVGVDATGTGLIVSGTGGSIIVPAISSVTCNPVNLSANTASSCTVILSSAAPTGGSSVTLASNNASLTVPASVTVAAGATTATFSATAAASIASNQSAKVTATLGSSSQTATITLLAPVLVSSLACAPTALGQSAVGTLHRDSYSDRSHGRIERNTGQQQRFAHRAGIGYSSGRRYNSDVQCDGSGFHRE